MKVTKLQNSLLLKNFFFCVSKLNLKASSQQEFQNGLSNRKTTGMSLKMASSK